MVQHIILYLSIKNNTNFKLTITKLHFSIAQMYFKPYYRQKELSSQLSWNSVLQQLLVLCIQCAGRHHTCSACIWAVAVNMGTEQSRCFLESSDYCHMLITYHEDLLITLLDVRSTRSKLPPLQLIQLAPNCALDKALREHVHSIQLRDGWEGSTGDSPLSTTEESMKQAIQIIKAMSSTAQTQQLGPKTPTLRNPPHT